MNTLIYKRTHRGDPGNAGIFGEHDCMGRVRSWDFDAVIGVGGKRPWRKHAEIARKINWIGLNARKEKAHKRNWGGPLVKFGRFILLDGNGPFLKELAPKLYDYMFEKQHVRAVLSQSLPPAVQREVRNLLRLATGHNKTITAEPLSLRRRCCGNRRVGNNEQLKC